MTYPTQHLFPLQILCVQHHGFAIMRRDLDVRRCGLNADFSTALLVVELRSFLQISLTEGL